MSTTIGNSSVSPWRIPTTEGINIDIKELRKQRYYNFRLESESSRGSEDDTESIYSLQGKDTDIITDSSDTDTSNINEDHYEIEFEYEVASLSENEDIEISTTDSEGMMLAAAAAVMCDSSLETWVTVTDVEDSGTSDDTSFGRTDFIACVQCKGENCNPLYRYCEKCFQSRKKFFPPRPRRNRKKNQTKEDKKDHVKLDALRSCLSGLSQDSGIGSSQECPSLKLDQIVIPEYLQNPGTSKAATENMPGVLKESKPKVERNSSLSRKRQSSESSLSEYEVKKPRIGSKSDALGTNLEPASSIEPSEFHLEKSKSIISLEKPDSFDSNKSETMLCMFCNSAPKDSVFLHTNIAHQCCCYPCAKKQLKSVKRCPICNRSVNKVVRIFTS